MAPPLLVRRATAADQQRIAWLSNYFWDETVVDCFDASYDVLQLEAFLAHQSERDDEAVGLVSYAFEEDQRTVTIVMLNVLPGFQGRGGGRQLLDAVRHEALRQGRSRLRVATSNDDLPALGLYQRHGFVLTGIGIDIIKRHHGGEIPGFSGIPVRDEIQLAYPLI